jgi:hypothetical protein
MKRLVFFSRKPVSWICMLFGFTSCSQRAKAAGRSSSSTVVGGKNGENEGLERSETNRA